jgi:hypothetical protein
MNTTRTVAYAAVMAKTSELFTRVPKARILPTPAAKSAISIYSKEFIYVKPTIEAISNLTAMRK